MLINAGVVRIVYQDFYPDPLADEMLEEAGIEICIWEGRGDIPLKQVLFFSFLSCISAVYRSSLRYPLQ